MPITKPQGPVLAAVAIGVSIVTALVAAVALFVFNGWPDGSEAGAAVRIERSATPVAARPPSRTPSPTLSTATATPTSTPTPEPTAPSEPVRVATMRLVIPRLSVDAGVVQLGIDANGVMEVPRNAYDVAWYTFTSVPGTSGNAVLAGHLNWAGAVGVFANLHQLAPGDEIHVVDGNDSLVYRVEQRYSVNADTADVGPILGTRDGQQTITLITCGGAFNPQERDYEERVIVRAVRVDSPAGHAG